MEAGTERRDSAPAETVAYWTGAFAAVTERLGAHDIYVDAVPVGDGVLRFAVGEHFFRVEVTVDAVPRARCSHVGYRAGYCAELACWNYAGKHGVL